MADETTAQRIELWSTRIKTMRVREVADLFTRFALGLGPTWAARIEDIMHFSTSSLQLVSKELEGRPEATLALHDLFVACMENAASLRTANAPALMEASTILHYINASADMAAPLEEGHVAALARILAAHREQIDLGMIRGYVRSDTPGTPAAILDILVDEAMECITNGAQLADFLDFSASQEAGMLPAHHTKILADIPDIATYRDDRWSDNYEDHVKYALMSYGSAAKGLTIDHHVGILAILLANSLDRPADAKRYLYQTQLSPQDRAVVGRKLLSMFRSELCTILDIPDAAFFDADEIIV